MTPITASFSIEVLLYLPGSVVFCPRISPVKILFVFVKKWCYPFPSLFLYSFSSLCLTTAWLQSVVNLPVMSAPTVSEFLHSQRQWGLLTFRFLVGLVAFVFSLVKLLLSHQSLLQRIFFPAPTQLSRIGIGLARVWNVWTVATTTSDIKWWRTHCGCSKATKLWRDQRILCPRSFKQHQCCRTFCFSISLCS